MFNRIKTNLRIESSKLRRKLLAPRGMRELPPKYPQDFSRFTQRLWDQVNPYTMTSQPRIVNLEYAVRYIVKHGIAGDFVECGVGDGGSIMAVALILRDQGIAERNLYLFDTFSGMPLPGDDDISVFGKSAKRKYQNKFVDGASTWHNFPLQRVQENLRRTAYPEKHLFLIQGLVQDTLPITPIGAVALLRLDTNFYESTKAEMEHLFPKLAAGGILIVDDYYKWLGQRKAVDEYLDANGLRLFLLRVDDHCAMAIKP